MRTLAKKLTYPRQNVAYYLPTYDLVRRIGFPVRSSLRSWASSSRRTRRIRSSPSPMRARSSSARWTPERIVGYEVADSIADELDTLRGEQARDVLEQDHFATGRKSRTGA